MATELIKKLLEAGVHFGHQSRRWNPKMKRFIFGERGGIYIIDLEKTVEQLNAARDAIRDIAAVAVKFFLWAPKNRPSRSLRKRPCAVKCFMSRTAGWAGF